MAPFPDLSDVATPTKAIITIPITLYGYGNGDDAEEGGSRETARWAGSKGSTSATKSHADPEPREPTSSRTSRAGPRVCHPARLWEACIIGAPPLEAAMPLRDTSFLISAASG